MSMFVVGLSHKTAPVTVRECLAQVTEVSPDNSGVSLDLMDEVISELSSRSEFAEYMFLSTCNRVELFLSARQNVQDKDVFLGARLVLENITKKHAQFEQSLEPYLYLKKGEEAVRHIFRVTSSLDSMVVGEPQILGQVKYAFDRSAVRGGLRSELGRCMHHAFKLAKRIRSDTGLAKGNVSISSVAVDFAAQIFGELQDHTVLLIGAGEMAESAAKALGKSAKTIRVCNRHFDRAVALASKFGGAASPLESLEEELLLADVALVSTRSSGYLVTRALVKRVMKARKGRTLFFIDISVPRNVDPAIHEMENVYVFNVDDLEGEVKRSLNAREAELAQAEKMVEEELVQWIAWKNSLGVKPLILELRAKAKGILEAELERGLDVPDDPGEMKRRALMIESITNKWLHAAMSRLKQASGGAEEFYYVRAASELFGLSERDETSLADAAKSVDSFASSPSPADTEGKAWPSLNVGALKH